MIMQAPIAQNDGGRRELLMKKRELLLRRKSLLESREVEQTKEEPDFKSPEAAKIRRQELGETLKAAGVGIVNTLQKTGTAVNQLAAELGTEAFANVSRSVAKIMAPQFAEEFDNFTKEEISDLIAESTKKQTTERIENLPEDKRIIAKGAEIATDVVLFGGKKSVATGVAKVSGLAASAVRVAKGAAKVGAASGAVSAFQPVEAGEGLAERGVQTAIGTGVGVGTLGVIKGTGAASRMAKNFVTKSAKNVKTGIGAKNIEELGAVGVGLKEKSSGLYEQMRNIDASINQKASKNISKELEKTLTDSGKLNKNLHGDTISVMEDIKEGTIRGKVGLEELDQHRQLLNQVVLKHTDLLGVKPDGQKALVLINKLDDIVENLKPSDLTKGGKEAVELLSKARSGWKVFKKHQAITNVIEKADGDPNKIRRSLSSFVANRKKMLGFTKQEQEALKRASKLTSGEQVLNALGKVGFSKERFVAPLLSGVLATPAVPVVGTIAGKAQKLISAGKIDDAITLIEKGGGAEIARVIKSVPTKEGRKLLLTKLLSVGAASEISEGQ